MLPELLVVWKLQAQMVADTAGIYDKNAYLTREQMIYCLFRRTVAQAVRDSVVHVGEPILVQGVPLGAMQAIARAVGISITGRAIGKAYPDGPIIGALRVGSYAYCGSKPLAAAQRITSYILLGPPGEPCHASVVAAS